jgi:hypothetical protein
MRIIFEHLLFCFGVVGRRSNEYCAPHHLKSYDMYHSAFIIFFVHSRSSRVGCWLYARYLVPVNSTSM